MPKLNCDSCNQNKYSTTYYKGNNSKFKNKKFCDYCYKKIVYNKPNNSWKN